MTDLIEKLRKRISQFEYLTSEAEYRYNENSADDWYCPCCGHTTNVIYIKPGVRETTPKISEIKHSYSCPYHPDNKIE